MEYQIFGMGLSWKSSGIFPLKKKDLLIFRKDKLSGHALSTFLWLKNINVLDFIKSYNLTDGDGISE
ncbi:MAG: hypothetical protein Q4F07_00640 [Bacteroidales bacterium]|nr:hypothetical protein [Bacteroidales bacterium]